MNIETIAVHSGRGVDPVTGAVTPPIHMSTTFERDGDGSYPTGFVYGRVGNPTRNLLEECVRDLEGGAAAAAFSSGMARHHERVSGPILWRPRNRAPGHIPRHGQAAKGTVRPLGLGFDLCGHDRPRSGPQSVEAFHQTHLGRDSFQSPAQDHRHPSCIRVGPRARYRLRVRQHLGQPRVATLPRPGS